MDRPCPGWIWIEFIDEMKGVGEGWIRDRSIVAFGNFAGFDHLHREWDVELEYLNLRSVIVV
jgi:hypothetical protein